MPTPPIPSNGITVDFVSELPLEDTAYDQNRGVDGIYEYFIRYRYTRDMHVEQLPTAVPQGNNMSKASIVQWADPTRVVDIEWTAKHSNTQPLIPHPDNADSNLVLLQDTVNPTYMDIAPDGTTEVFTISGRYLYAVIDTTKSIFQYGLAPWIDESRQQDTSFDQAIFTHGIIDPITTPNITDTTITSSIPINPGAVGPKIQ